MTITSYAPRAKASLAAFPARERASLLAHPKAILFAVLALHFAAFSLVAILTQPTLPLDVIEQVSWARNPEWAYFKHPPLPAWCLAALMALDGRTTMDRRSCRPGRRNPCALDCLAPGAPHSRSRPGAALRSAPRRRGPFQRSKPRIQSQHHPSAALGFHRPMQAIAPFAKTASPIGCCSASPRRLACSANTPRRSF